MQVTPRNIRQFLESAMIFKGMSAERRNKYLLMYERATKTTSALTGMPGGGNSDHEAVLASMVDVGEDVKKWDALSVYRRELVKKFIDDAEIEDYHKNILHWRYILGTPWEVMLPLLQGDKEMSLRTLYYDHKKALQACADWVNQSGKYKEEIV